MVFIIYKKNIESREKQDGHRNLSDAHLSKLFFVFRCIIPNAGGLFHIFKNRVLFSFGC